MWKSSIYLTFYDFGTILEINYFWKILHKVKKNVTNILAKSEIWNGGYKHNSPKPFTQAMLYLPQQFSIYPSH